MKELDARSILENAENELKNLPLIHLIEVKISFPDCSWLENLFYAPKVFLTYDADRCRLGFSDGYTWKDWRDLSSAKEVVAAAHCNKLLEKARKVASKVRQKYQ